MRTQSSASQPDGFGHDRYLVRSKFLRLFGGAFHIFDDAGRVVLYSEMKRFRLREDIRLYDDASMASERLKISTQSVFDLAGAYDVHDTQRDERVGTLKRSGLSSTFMRDHWTVLDPRGETIGEIQEDSLLKALARRFIELVALLLPQKYHVAMDGRTVATMNQRLNPFLYKLDVDFSQDRDGRLDRRLGLAASVLLAGIEGRQS